MPTRLQTHSASTFRIRLPQASFTTKLTPIECDLWVAGACDYDYLNSIGLATASDNCELDYVDVACTPLSSACTDDYIIDYTAYDKCGNSTSIQQIVVTADRTAPEFTFAPADLTLECSDASLTGDVDGYRRSGLYTW